MTICIAEGYHIGSQATRRFRKRISMSEQISVVLIFLGLGRLIAGGLLSGTLIDEAWQGITAEVNSHFLDRYRQLLG
jgi:hypothetical protein